MTDNGFHLITYGSCVARMTQSDNFYSTHLGRANFTIQPYYTRAQGKWVLFRNMPQQPNPRDKRADWPPTTDPCWWRLNLKPNFFQLLFSPSLFFHYFHFVYTSNINMCWLGCGGTRVANGTGCCAGAWVTEKVNRGRHAIFRTACCDVNRKTSNRGEHWGTYPESSFTDSCSWIELPATASSTFYGMAELV